MLSRKNETIMVSPVSNQSALYIPAQPSGSRQTTAPKQQEPAQDSVHLSAQAKAAAASGDVDHDGDSH
jgi:hypothetical protein